MRFARWLISLILLAAGGYVYVRYIEPHCILTSRIRIEHDALANSLGHGRMVHLTDLHIDRFGPRERLMIWLVNRQRPDWIVITGDLVNRRENWPVVVEIIGRLKARRSLWIIAGNTDNLVVPPEKFDADLARIGATVLRNRMAPIEDTGAWFLGLDDPIDNRARFEDTLKEWSPEAYPATILLSHGPQVMPKAVAARIPLVLAGHTHGGQLGIPWLRQFSDYANRGKYMSGRYEEGETVLYVNRGIGWKTAPYRLLASPEIGVIRFVPKRRGWGSGLAALFHRRSAEPRQPGRTRWLSDFETPNEHAMLWNSQLVHAKLTPEHATHGRLAARVTFPYQYHTSFAMERSLMRTPESRDWTGFASLRFDIVNVSPQDERLDVKVGSAGRKVFTKRLTLPAGVPQTIDIPLDEMGEAINLSQINRLGLSRIMRGKRGEPASFVIDAFRLEPADPAGGGVDAEPGRDQAGRSEAPSSHPIDSTGLLRQTDRAAEWRRTDPATGEPVTQVDVNLVGPDDLPMSAGFVVSGGIPLPKGHLKPGDPVRLTDGGGIRWPVQARPMATWDDGSLRWLQLTTLIPNQARGRHLRLDYGPAIRQPEPVFGPVVSVEDRPEAVIVNTGILRFSVSKQQFTVLDSAFVDRNFDGLFSDEERMAGPGDLVITRQGVEYRSSRDAKSYHVTVEEAGPLRATLKASGWFRAPDGKGFCQFTVRLQAFAGLPQLRLFHTFIYTGYPANQYHDEYKGKPLPENETIDEISVELAARVHGPAGLLTADDQGAFSTMLDQPATISQLAADAYTVRASSAPEAGRPGRRHEGWMLVQDGAGGVMAGVRDAWQQFPKELTADSSGRMVLKLWPASAGPLNLETGEAAYGPDERARGSAFGLAKTHEITLSFLGVPVDPATARAIAGLWSEPWLLAADPEWLRATDVLGPVGSERFEGFRQAEGMLVDLFEWGARQPQLFNWYGMIDYGDTLTWYRKESFDKSYDDWGWHPEGRWGWHNCEAAGAHTGALIGFLRTHDLKYFRFGEAKARHVMDVDTVHYNTVASDPRLTRVISDAFSKVGSMHRHNAYHWGGRNEEATHTNVAGLLLYYYMTGYDRAWDVANEVGSFLLLNPVTYRNRPHIAPLRAIANVLWGDVLMYEATGDRRYREEADRWAKVLARGQSGDGTWPETYNPLLRSWNGAVKNNYIALHALPALVAYHRLTGDKDVAQAILRGTDAMIEREEYLPFFEGLAYSYRLTGSERYRNESVKRLKDLIRYQQHDKDPIRDGQMFQKTIYDHMGPVLYSAPLAIGMEEPADPAVGEVYAEPGRDQTGRGEARPTGTTEPLMPGGRPSPVDAGGAAGRTQR